jgi:hypothetical protein
MAGMKRDPLNDVHNTKTNAFAGLADFWERKLKFTVYEEASGMEVEAQLEFHSEAFERLSKAPEYVN